MEMAERPCLGGTIGLGQRRSLAIAWHLKLSATPRTEKARYRYADKLSLNINHYMFLFLLYYTYRLSSILLAVFFKVSGMGCKQLMALLAPEFVGTTEI